MNYPIGNYILMNFDNNYRIYIIVSIHHDYVWCNRVHEDTNEEFYAFSFGGLLVGDPRIIDMCDPHIIDMCETKNELKEKYPEYFI